MQLLAAVTLIALGGTGKADPGWVTSPDSVNRFGPSTF